MHILINPKPNKQDMKTLLTYLHKRSIRWICREGVEASLVFWDLHPLYTTLTVRHNCTYVYSTDEEPAVPLPVILNLIRRRLRPFREWEKPRRGKQDGMESSRS